jgi:hypothetical protein
VVAEPESGVAAGDGVGVFACGGIGRSVPSLGGSGGSIRGWFRRAVKASAGICVEAGHPEDELGAFACGGAGGVVPVFTATGCDDSVRLSPRNAVKASNGPRADVDPADEIDVFACATTDGAASVLAGRESGGRVRGEFREGVEVSAGLRVGFEAEDKLEVVACAMTGAAAPFLPKTVSGGSDFSGAAAAGAPAGRRRLAPIAGIGPGINMGAGPRG